MNAADILALLRERAEALETRENARTIDTICDRYAACVLREVIADVEAHPEPEGPPVIETDGWAASTPDGLEFFDDRARAEAHLLDWYEGQLHDTGEAEDSTGLLLRVVAHTSEVIGARAEDDTEGGEWCRSHGFDYMISGYEIRPGSGMVQVAPAPEPDPWRTLPETADEMPSGKTGVIVAWYDGEVDVMDADDVRALMGPARIEAWMPLPLPPRRTP